MKPWIETWRRHGIPEPVDVDAHPSVVHLLEGAMRRYADRPAFRSFGRGITYGELDRLSGAVCAWLQHRLVVKKGDRVAVMMPNLLAFPIACLGILRAGAVQVNVNPLYTPRELEHQLADAGATVIVIFDGSTPTLAEVIERTAVKHVVTTGLGDGSQQPRQHREDQRLAAKDVQRNPGRCEAEGQTIRCSLWCAAFESVDVGLWLPSNHLSSLAQIRAVRTGWSCLLRSDRRLV